MKHFALPLIATKHLAHLSRGSPEASTPRGDLKLEKKEYLQVDIFMHKVNLVMQVVKRVNLCIHSFYKVLVYLQIIFTKI